MTEKKKNSKCMLAVGSVEEKSKIMNLSSTASFSQYYSSSHKTTEVSSSSLSLFRDTDKTYSTPTLLLYSRRIVLPTIFGFEAYYYDNNNNNISGKVKTVFRKMSKVLKIFNVLVCYVRPTDMDRYLGDLMDQIVTERDLRAWIDPIDNGLELTLGSKYDGAVGHHNNPDVDDEDKFFWITGIDRRKEKKMKRMRRENRWNYVMKKFKKYLRDITLDHFLNGTSHNRPIKSEFRRIWQLWKEVRDHLPPPPPPPPPQTGTPPVSDDDP